MDSVAPPLSSGANRIFKLPDAVVNRIAAGEIIQRPVSALKEMLENSLDAGATQINVTLKEGGNRFLQIQDNGSGIQECDLPLLCERHATSKLRSFEDLEKIDTLGFRGEALASISFVGHFTVTTMTQDALHGHRVSYRDGVMDPSGPKPCAAVQGTVITVEDLFYNVPTRKKALKSPSEEFSRILEIMTYYAIFKPEVGFNVKKQGESRADLHTLSGAQRIDNIRALYGGSLARNVVEFTSSVTLKPAITPFKDAANGVEPDDEDVDLGDLQFEAKGFISNADYAGKKTTFILFINGRPVDCNPLKRSIELTYSTVLPKASKPWIFLDLRLPGNHVDVNLHPTKREVGFLHQDQLIDALTAAIEQKLITSNAQRTFTQTQLSQPAKASLEGQRRSIDSQGSDPLVSTRRDKAGGDHKLIRTDSRARTLDSFMRPSQPSHSHSAPPQEEHKALRPTAVTGAKRRGAERGTVRLREQWEVEERASSLEHARSVKQKPNPPISELQSIRELLEEVSSKQHAGLSEIIKGHTFVGMADATMALIQHGTRLCLSDTTKVTRQMFYQQVLSRFERVEAIKLSCKVNVRELALLALEAELDHPEDESANKEELADLIQKLMSQKAALLEECFGLRFDESGNLVSIPKLIEGYIPNTDYLPSLILSLAREVDWTEEKQCFRGVALALAEFYSWKADLPDDAAQHDGPSTEPSSAKETAVDKETLEDRLSRSRSLEDTRHSAHAWTVQHVLYPALRTFWRPVREDAQDCSIMELTRLEHLYKIFERC